MKFKICCRFGSGMVVLPGKSFAWLQGSTEFQGPDECLYIGILHPWLPKYYLVLSDN